MKPLKLGILGISRHFFLRCYQPLKDSNSIEITAIASRSEQKAKEAATKWNIDTYYNSYEKLLQDDNIEAVYIPLPNHLHKEWIKKSIDASKHVICEKPITLNSQEALEISDYANKKGKGIKLMEGFMYRFHPKWIKVYQIIEQGEIGDVLSTHIIFTFNNTNPNNIRNIKEYGGGSIYDLGCYAVSTARYISNSEPTRAIGVATFDPNFNTDILTSAIIDFGKSRCLFTISTQSYPQQEVSIYGTSGKITIPIPYNDFYDTKSNIIIETSVGKRNVEFNPVNQYQLEFEAFAKAVREDLDVPLNINESINNMKVIDAIFESIDMNRWIDIQ
ncbi:deoxyfructose oxidoreductase [Vallitalea longa]|uniref:Deoxyfructose oxidoreductase n=1 Tax=Vallitalea longa TaxID=2936439 RepID=A0A9W5Y8Y0_9FIRM|nr:Gfo/Idh/MocA family oxidoreductase [Vallitalea longa]GKX28046.1 deoxyfructose oxidoreductase [Vallitalea longa]